MQWECPTGFCFPLAWNDVFYRREWASKGNVYVNKKNRTAGIFLWTGTLSVITLNTCTLSGTNTVLIPYIQKCKADTDTHSFQRRAVEQSHGGSTKARFRAVKGRSVSNVIISRQIADDSCHWLLMTFIIKIPFGGNPKNKRENHPNDKWCFYLYGWYQTYQAVLHEYCFPENS